MERIPQYRAITALLPPYRTKLKMAKYRDTVVRHAPLIRPCTKCKNKIEQILRQRLKPFALGLRKYQKKIKHFLQNRELFEHNFAKF